MAEIGIGDRLDLARRDVVRVVGLHAAGLGRLAARLGRAEALAALQRLPEARRELEEAGPMLQALASPALAAEFHFLTRSVLEAQGNLRGALVVIILLPLATLGAALPLAWMGLGLNALTLGGLAISVGLLVDANGEKITDISQLTFTETLEAGVSRLIDRINDRRRCGNIWTARLAQVKPFSFQHCTRRWIKVFGKLTFF